MIRVDPKDQFEHLTELCFAVLATSGWEDAPFDKNRTMGNMQAAAIRYCEHRVEDRVYRMEHWPIYVENEDDPKCLVGIEQNFDVVLLFEDGHKVRYIGTIDGLVSNVRAGSDRWFLDENKTSVRLGDGWRASFDMSHQVTGYCGASTTVFGFPVMRNRVTGSKIPPSNATDDVVPLEPHERDANYIHIWAQWVREMSDKFDKYKDHWEQAGRYHHSCWRFFRPCALMSFCADTPAGREIAFNRNMVEANQTPSERAIASV